MRAEWWRALCREERLNVITHGAMVIFFFFWMIGGCLWVWKQRGMADMIGILLFFLCMLAMFLASTLYHAMPAGTTIKHALHVADHICIYLAIAGSYTPAVLSLMDGWARMALLLFQWGMVLFGCCYKVLAKQKNTRLSLILYLCMGWSVLLLLPQLLARASSLFLTLVAGGGVAYSIGAYIYAKKPFPYAHALWHLFVALASILQGVAFVYCL